MYKGKKVGILALLSGRKAAFEYDDTWIEEGFSISLFSLPLKKKVFIPSKDYFRGLYRSCRFLRQLRIPFIRHLQLSVQLY